MCEYGSAFDRHSSIIEEFNLKDRHDRWKNVSNLINIPQCHVKLI